MDKQKWDEECRRSPFCTEKEVDGVTFEFCYRFDNEGDIVVTGVAKVIGTSYFVVPEEDLETNKGYYTDLCGQACFDDDSEEDYHGESVAERNRGW